MWVAEGHGGDQFAILAACALRTRRVRLGTAITSVFVRTAPTIAMAAAAVDELSGGRFVLGLGSSHRVQVGPEHGVDYARPLGRVRDTAAVVRALLRDGEVSHDGETVRIERFDLWFRAVPERHADLHFRPVPKMTELCGEIADGVILTAGHACERGRGARPCGRRRPQGRPRRPARSRFRRCCPRAWRRTATTPLAAARPGLAFYAGFFPRYNRLIAESGFAQEGGRDCPGLGPPATGRPRSGPSPTT